MNNFTSLKERLDLLTEIEKDLGPGHKSGRWVLFSCPFPGHKHGDANPSLSVTEDNGRFYCFSCGRSGDLITWLREYREMNWKDIAALAESDSLPPSRPRPAQIQTQIGLGGPPSEAWQRRGLAFIEYAESQLWGDPGRAEKVYQVAGMGEALTPLEYLHWRGLTDSTIRFWRLGYNPSGLRDKREAWGLDIDSKANSIYLPRGITIPCLITRDWSNQAQELWYIKIRRITADPKYKHIAGGRPALYGADSLYVAGNGTGIGLLVEGEFDAILANQVLPELGAATLGSAGKHFDPITWGAYLLPLRWVLAAYDLDPAGAAGLAGLIRQARRIHPVRVPVLRPGDKDLTDYSQAGGDLWAWLRCNLERLGALDMSAAADRINISVGVAI